MCVSRACRWRIGFLVDAGDVVVLLFRPDVRSFYNLENIWSGNHTTALPS